MCGTIGYGEVVGSVSEEVFLYCKDFVGRDHEVGAGVVYYVNNKL